MEKYSVYCELSCDWNTQNEYFRSNLICVMRLLPEWQCPIAKNVYSKVLYIKTAFELVLFNCTQEQLK